MSIRQVSLRRGTYGRTSATAPDATALLLLLMALL